MFWSTFTCFFFHFFTLSLSPQEYFLTLVPSLFFLLSCSARCSWPSSNQSPNDATTHLFYLLSHFFARSLSYFFFISLSHTVNRLTLSRTTIASYSLFSLSHSHAHRTHTTRSLFLHVCVFALFFLSPFFVCVCLCSSFIDYLNVTTKLDISTSSNKLGFVFFNVCFSLYFEYFLVVF